MIRVPFFNCTDLGFSPRESAGRGANAGRVAHHSPTVEIGATDFRAVRIDRALRPRIDPAKTQWSNRITVRGFHLALASAVSVMLS